MSRKAMVKISLITFLSDTHSSVTLFQGASTDREKARLNCVVSKVPSKALGLHLRKQEFLFAVKYRLGLRVFQSEGECPMDRCGAHSDAFGDHAIGCGLNGERIDRHNHIRDAVFSAASEAMLGPVRPADVYIPYWTQVKPTAIDVTVHVESLMCMHVKSSRCMREIELCDFEHFPHLAPTMSFNAKHTSSCGDKNIQPCKSPDYLSFRKVCRAGSKVMVIGSFLYTAARMDGKVGLMRLDKLVMEPTYYMSTYRCQSPQVGR